MKNFNSHFFPPSEFIILNTILNEMSSTMKQSNIMSWGDYKKVIRMLCFDWKQNKQNIVNPDTFPHNIYNWINWHFLKNILLKISEPLHWQVHGITALSQASPHTCTHPVALTRYLLRMLALLRWNCLAIFISPRQNKEEKQRNHSQRGVSNG